MGASSLGSRAIIGKFFQKLEESTQDDYSPEISMHFDSDQASERYNWLGNVPAVREKIGGYQATAFRENGITVDNKKFECTLKVSTDDLRRDKTGQIRIRAAEQGKRMGSHWQSLLSTLIANGETQKCYDGQNFFSTTHIEGDNTINQSNLITYDISTDSVVGSEWRGTSIMPSPLTVQAAIMRGVEAILGFKDDQNEPINQGASKFIVMIPTKYWRSTTAAISLPTLDQGAANVIASLKNSMTFKPVINTRLNWTDSLAIFRTDAETKPFIRQTEVDPEYVYLDENSEHAKKNDEVLFIAKTTRNAAYGMWQHAVKVKLQD